MKLPGPYRFRSTRCPESTPVKGLCEPTGRVFTVSLRLACLALVFGFFISPEVLLAQPSACTTDADCDDGLFCTGAESCIDGTCAAVSACPPGGGCLNPVCDEASDQCLCGDFCEEATPAQIDGIVSGSTVGATFTVPDSPSDCCYENGSTGCAEPSCESTVCAVDPFCCNDAWDALCAREAIELCAEDLCGRGNTLFCGTTHTAPERWYTVVGTGNMLTASTCNMADFDTKLSIFCDDCDEPVCIGGVDDAKGCELTSELSWCSQAGAEYRIMVHGFGSATGDFDLEVFEGDPCNVEPLCPLLEDLTKEITSGPSSNGQDIDLAVEIKPGEPIHYDFTIQYSGPSEDVVIVDTLPAEWVATLVQGEEVYPPLECGEADEFVGGDVLLFKGGKGGKSCQSATQIWWSDPSGNLKIDAETRESPGKGHKDAVFAPTSCGPLYLNEGAAAYPAENGEPLLNEEPLAVSNALCVAAVADLDDEPGILPDGTGDEDEDGFSDYDEACHWGTDPCIFTADTDQDGVPDPNDNCVDTANPDQADTDGDGIGDTCDNCPDSTNPDQADDDGDGAGNACDICPGGDDTVDTDGDGTPDFCDPCPLDDPDDTDGDGVCDSEDPCPQDNPDDSDFDGVCDSEDPCPYVFDGFIDCVGSCDSDLEDIGDGICHEPLNCDEFQFDGGDCEGCNSDSEIEACDGFDTCVPDYFLGDNNCDLELDCAEHNYDNGDCVN